MEECGYDWRESAEIIAFFGCIALCFWARAWGRR
jgi:hypothetical protein